LINLIKVQNTSYNN